MYVLTRIFKKKVFAFSRMQSVHLKKVAAGTHGACDAVSRARICKRFRSPRIDYKESIPPGYVAWPAGT
jgi:hypothetical protein